MVIVILYFFNIFQVFKTANRGWGIRALNDIPKGAFLCVYAGNLLTDATANLVWYYCILNYLFEFLSSFFEILAVCGTRSVLTP